MRKFIIHPVARAGRVKLAKKTASMRALLVLAEGVALYCFAVTKA